MCETAGVIERVTTPPTLSCDGISFETGSVCRLGILPVRCSGPCTTFTHSFIELGIQEPTDRLFIQEIQLVEEREGIRRCQRRETSLPVYRRPL